MKYGHNKDNKTIAKSVLTKNCSTCVMSKAQMEELDRKLWNESFKKNR